MDAFSSSPLTESFPCGRFDSPAISPAASPTRTEVDFPADVDQSFNSSMSFSVTDSPPAPSPSMHLGKPSSHLLLHSPTPLLRAPRRADMMSLSYSALGSVREGEALGARPRPLGPSRTFGRELSLNTSRLSGPSSQTTTMKGKSKLLPPAVVPEARRPVSPVRLHHATSHEDMSSPKLLLPRMGRRESAPTLESPLAPSLLPSLMDIDSPRPSRLSTHQSPSFGSPGLGSFFCESPAVPALSLAKRRALASSSPASPSSSPSSRRASRTLDKGSCSGLLFGAGSRSNSLAARRSAAPYKRPPLNVQPTGENAQRAEQTSSAYPILYGTSSQRNSFPSMRRAFSVADQGTTSMAEDTEDESEFDRSPSVNSSAAIRRRYGAPPNPRINNGSPGFKPMRSSMSTIGEVEKRMMPEKQRCALPELHDEVRGKILPCHKSSNDQLMRITVDTLKDVLDGRYNDRMKQYHILDCRFDYEYDGGHIAGAINVRDEGHLDELLLTASFDAPNNLLESLPAPSCSGELGSEQQVVLIFHCEYSAHRAPTVATKFRHRDRKMNNDFYPKVHYPEIYILDGGYCDFFKASPTQCEPQAYVEMKDPAHTERCDTGMAHFRRFNRARSYTYGELQQTNRSKYRSHNSEQRASSGQMSATGGMGFLMAAASAAVGRRGNGTAISEEREPESSPSGASPCPRALAMGQAPIFGSAKQRGFERAGLQRFASCADAMVRR